jgi:sec-independent protein translocase protein TatB
MFDLGWMELTVIAVTALIVVGPKDLPGMFKKVGYFAGRVRSMAREFQRAMENAADETGLKETARMVNNLSSVQSPQGMAKSILKDTTDEVQKASADSELKGKPDNELKKSRTQNAKYRKKHSNADEKKVSE